MADLITIKFMSKELKREPDTVKRQLQAKGIKPVEYHGPTGMYEHSAMEEIRIVPPVGRPKKAAPVKPAKPKKKEKKL
jgi:hypothetical protein